MGATKFIRDNGDAVEIDVLYRVLSNEALELTKVDAWLWEDRNNLDAPNVELTDTEMDRIERDLYADPATWEYRND